MADDDINARFEQLIAQNQGNASGDSMPDVPTGKAGSANPQTAALHSQLAAKLAPQSLPDDYMQHSERLQAATINEEFNALLRGQQPAAAQETDAETAPTNQPTLGSRAVAVAKDVGMGVVETPRALFKGVRDAYQSMIDLAGDAVDFARTHLPEPPPDIAARSAARLAAVGNVPTSLELPDIAPPKSVTGTIEKNIIEFMTSLRAAGGQLKALGLPEEAAGWTGRALTGLKGFVGMFEGFDGANQNLSNLVQSVPALQNPVSKFLATDPNDSDAVNRLKSAVEGTIGGQLVDGFIGGLKFLRSANAAKSAAESAAGDLASDEIGPPKSTGMSVLGDPTAADNAPLVSAKFNTQASTLAKQTEATAGTTPEQVVEMGKPASPDELAGPASPGATEAQAKEPQIYVNFARIDTPDDVSRAMSQMADTFKGNIDDARRGVQTFEDTKLGADAVNAWDTLMSRRVGEPLNAEQSLAARQLWASSAAKTQDLASIAVESPTPENLFAFRKMLATHAAIQEQVIAARTETARALSSWRIPAGSADYRMAQMMSALGGDATRPAAGLDASFFMAQQVKALAEAGDVQGLDAYLEKSVGAKTRDAALEVWTNGLLTSPLTHVKVTVSNAATVALRIGERAVASRLSAVLGDTNGVQVGEAAAQFSGLVGGLKDAFRYAGKAANAFLNEEPMPALGDDPLSNAIKSAKSGVYSAGEDTPEWRFGGAVSSQAFGMANSGWLGSAVDYLGQAVRSPGRALTAEHDFFRSIGYRMELNALATRQAISEVNAGKITQDALGSRIQEIIANPPPSVTIGSIDAMKYQTFTDAPGKLAQNIENLRNDFPLLRVILPFYKIPSRILSFTFERSPVAPLMARYQANIAAGGARASLARAQMGLGTGIMLATADAVLSGQITGSGPLQKGQRAAMEDQGWQPYSMKVGDRWVQYNRLETTGSSMAMAADVVETLKSFSDGVNGDDPDVTKLAVATTLAIAQNITSKTYLQGLASFFDMLANPKSEGESRIRSLAGSVVPAGAASIARVNDPYQRAVYSMLDAIKARTPGASESLPARRNVWGEPTSTASGFGGAYDMLSPFSTREPSNEPIDAEILRLGANVNLPAARTSFGQGAVVDLQKNPQAYSRYVELAGHAYQDPAYGNLGAKELLNQMVSGTHWLSPVYNLKSDGPDGGKAEMIRSIMNQYRDGAKRQLLEEYPELQHEVTEKVQQRQALRLPRVG